MTSYGPHQQDVSLATGQNQRPMLTPSDVPGSRPPTPGRARRGVGSPGAARQGRRGEGSALRARARASRAMKMLKFSRSAKARSFLFFGSLRVPKATVVP